MAFGVATQVFAHLARARNYFAHRNRDTRATAQGIGPSYGLSALLHPADMLLARPVGRPQALILEWIDDIEIVVSYLCD
jgi:hypothetical protein